MRPLTSSSLLPHGYPSPLVEVLISCPRLLRATFCRTTQWSLDRPRTIMPPELRSSPIRATLKALLRSLLSPPPPPATRSNTSDERSMLLDLWKKAVETQMHFNEMSVKSRQLGLSFVVAALGVSVVLLGKSEDFQIPLPLVGYQIHSSGPLILLSAFGVYAVMRLDLGVYHKMLRGAVAFGEDLERELVHRGIIPVSKGMTQSISAYSRELDSRRTTAGAKIRRFYLFLVLVLVLLGSSLILGTASPLPAEASLSGGSEIEANGSTTSDVTNGDADD